MSSVTLLVIALIAFTLLWFLSFLVPPRSFPQNIPAIPFYVTLLPFLGPVDQSEIYEKYIEKPLTEYGAVKIFFGARWNVLVQRPSYVAEILRDEETYAKSGNQKKIPQSVLAEYTGDNVISAHGESHRLYKSILKPGLLGPFDTNVVLQNAEKLERLFLEQKADISGVSVTALLQRYTLANASESLMATTIGTLESPNAPVHVMQSAVKREVFKPIFMSFPFLDHFPFPTRQDARDMVRHLSDEICRLVRTQQRAVDKELESNPKLGGVAKRLVEAQRDGRISEKQFRDNTMIVYIAGSENPQLALISILYVLAKHQGIQDQLRAELSAMERTDNLSIELERSTLLTSVLYETLRLYPPISQLVNRLASKEVVLGRDILIPAGTYVGYNAYATGRDKVAWGADADSFLPQRWGHTIDEVVARYRTANAKAEFISFHGGRRACLGQRFALFQIRLTLYHLLRSLKWRLDPSWQERMTPAGPLYPADLRLCISPV